MAKSAKSAHFEPKKSKIAETDFFFENPAVSVYSHFGPLTPCRKAKKSLEPFSGTFADGLHTDKMSYSSTEVENCNVRCALVSTSENCETDELKKLFELFKTF